MKRIYTLTKNREERLLRMFDDKETAKCEYLKQSKYWQENTHIRLYKVYANGKVKSFIYLFNVLDNEDK